ncbi:DUF6463 family protein [Nocardia sp. NPDC058658]|uniref:DUF6463 family protein n=1 Tax=Nocardia sp. NPDC058658 TaxID=3346580 RepID=UPI003650468E
MTGRRMTLWAGVIITLGGIGHTVGSLVETAPTHLGSWFDGHLWDQYDYAEWSDSAAGFWYSALSFGPPLLLVGVLVLWMARNGITPPAFLAVALVGWVVITFVASGPSPLPILLIPAGLLLAARRVPVDQHA